MINHLLLTMALALGGKEPAGELYHDLRGRPASSDFFAFGAAAEEFAKSEPEGLRITLPKDRPEAKPVVWRTNFGIQGDFDITATFQILEAETPPSGFGVGIGVRLQKEDSPEATSLCRLVRSKGAPIVFWDRSLDVPGGNLKFVAGSVPCPADLGRLRLKRTGKTLAYLWAAGATGDEFEKIHEEPFGDNDIKHATFLAFTGQKPCKLDARWIDMRIRGGNVPSTDAGPGPGGAPPPVPPSLPRQEERSRTLWWLAGALALVFVVAAGFLMLWWLKRKGALSAQAAATAADDGVQIECPQCGRRLKMSARSQGKKVRCPGCSVTFVGEAVGDD